MATPRTTTVTANTGKRLADFPEFVEAQDKLNDLQAGLDEANQELAAARESSSGAHAAAVEHSEAMALLNDGGGVASAIRPLADLQHDVRVRTLAVTAQKQAVDAIADRLEQSVTAE